MCIYYSRRYYVCTIVPMNYTIYDTAIAAIHVVLIYIYIYIYIVSNVCI